MNRQLAAVILAAFRDDQVEDLRGRFASFDEREWLRSKDWLHTSGLALYFLARARILGIEDVMPTRILGELEGNHAENGIRTEAMFREFVKINMEFQRTKLSYANLKGFTLASRSYPDPTCRYQHDLDFLISPRDAEQCRQALGRHGYQLARVFDGTWEFKAGTAEVSSLRDLYKARQQRSVDVRFLSEKEESESPRGGDRLSRLQLQAWNGFEFPALSERDKFITQALHLFKHFKTAWTRTAWMLEYATAIRSHENDETFWQGIADDIADAPETKVGIGMASLIAGKAFGVSLPTRLQSCTVDELPERVGLWIDHYQDEVVFQEHPGSKLYLLLQDVLFQDRPDWQSQRRKSLFPAYLPPKASLTTRSDGIKLRTKVALAQLRFILGRLYFHIAEGLRYKIEAARWKKFVSDSRS